MHLSTALPYLEWQGLQVCQRVTCSFLVLIQHLLPPCRCWMEKLAVSWNVSQMDVVHCTSPLLAQRGSKRAETQSENSCYLAAASRQLGHRRKDRVMEVVKAKTQAKDAEMGPHQGSSLVAPAPSLGRGVGRPEIGRAHV